ncbi:ABC transporter permease subunit/CPBP intramembrane protease, partial [Candidatus Hydrogenedentota bacterium]
MKLQIVLTIFRKELIEMLRDKVVILMVIITPALLYPAIAVVIGQAAIVVTGKMEKEASSVAIIADEESTVVEWFESASKIELTESSDPETDLLDGTLDAIVVVKGDISDSLSQGADIAIEIKFDMTEPTSDLAVTRITRSLHAEEDSLKKKRLEMASISAEYIDPFDIKSTNVAPPSKLSGTVIGMILPYLMIVMLVIGAYYSAADLTVGEKERGTLETLLCAPITSLEIATGKFLTVLSLAMTSVLLNLGSMFLTATFLFSQVKDLMPEGSSRLAELSDIRLTPQTILQIIVIVIPLALFICGASMALAMLARNRKQADLFLTPFLLIVMVPSTLGMIPGTELSAFLQFVPVVNVALLCKDLMTDKGSFESVFLVFLAMTVYASLALLFAAWIFQREEAILSEDRGIPLTLRRSLFRPQKTLNPGMALMTFALILLLIFYIAMPFQGREIFSGLLITEWLVIFLSTVFLLWYTRTDMRHALNLKLPTPGSFLATLLIAVSTVPLSIQLGVWHNKIFPMPEEIVNEFSKLFEVETFGFMPLLFVVAFSPARVSRKC